METVGPTGVEMEALTAVQVALLTIYDMCKAADRGMSIHDVRVLQSTGASRGVMWRTDARCSLPGADCYHDHLPRSEPCPYPHHSRF